MYFLCVVHGVITRTMAARVMHIDVQYYGCAQKTCRCIHDKKVATKIGDARTWNDVRLDVARQLQLPADRIHMWREIGPSDFIVMRPLAMDKPAESLYDVYAQEVRD